MVGLPRDYQGRGACQVQAEWPRQDEWHGEQ